MDYYDDIDPFEEDEDFDEYEAVDCGFDEDFEGKCWHVGSEHCSFWCIYHGAVFGDEND